MWGQKRSWSQALAVGASLAACGGRVADETTLSGSASTETDFFESGQLSLSDAQLSGPWRALAVPRLGGIADVARSKDGFLALSNRPRPGSDDSGLDQQNALYFSPDGISWERRELGPDLGPQVLYQVVCSATHCVVAGRRADSIVTYSSVDSQTWTRTDYAGTRGPERLEYAGDQFFLIDSSTGSIHHSTDGAEWTRAELSTGSNRTFFLSLAYGNGRYIAGGTSAEATVVAYTSTDGHFWEPLPSIDFCTTTTEQGSNRNVCSLFRIFFAQGEFYGQGLRSRDGQRWDLSPVQAPWDSVGSSLISYGPELSIHVWDAERQLTQIARDNFDAPPGAETISAWLLPSNEPPPLQIEFPWPDGLNCRNRRCVVMDGELFLIPED